MKICTKCLIEKNLSEFYLAKGASDGHTYNCKSCYAAYRESKREQARIYMSKLRETRKDELNAKKREFWNKQDFRKKLICQVRARAKTRGFDFDLEINDIPYTEICPLLGCKLIPGTQHDYEYTHSLDRIDPTKGYIKGNVWVMSKKANSMKNNASKEELILFAENVLKLFKN
jgi:hypothetical protein